MIVYGDAASLESAAAVAASVRTILDEVTGAREGIARHATLVRAFIRASELVQGIADAETERLGFDARSVPQEKGSAFLLDMARIIDGSWRSGYAGEYDMQRLAQQLEQFAKCGWIRTRTAEGYAHYALYPESYLEAARRSGLGSNTCVIGIRSIGTGLAALVSAALGARSVFTVRPTGHPFDREIKADPALVSDHAKSGDGCFAVVDEGPGHSGSSFASVAVWLARQGVDMGRVHFFPSHDGEPGSAASPRTRSIWKLCQRHPARAEDVLFRSDGLRSWVADSVGPLDGPLDKFQSTSAAYRDARFERCKFVARNPKGTWLIKFAGLGEMGHRKFEDAKALRRGGFSPQAVALCHGFIVQKWVNGVPLCTSGDHHAGLLPVLAKYVAYRATLLGRPTTGAPMEQLFAMAIQNTSEALGTEAAQRIKWQLSNLTSLDTLVRRVRTDNRLHAWEWLKTGDGFLKSDAVDHCEAHDIVGCQDITWDVAGSVVEYDLTPSQIRLLCGEVERSGARVDLTLLSAMIPCYLAFQVGLWSTAVGNDGSAGTLARRYARKLAAISVPS